MGGNQKRQMVVSEIRSLYRDENDLFRTVIKRIYEQWNAQLQQWDLRRIEFIFEDPELPLPSDTPCGSSRTAARVAHSAGMGIYIGDLGVRTETGAGNRV